MSFIENLARIGLLKLDAEKAHTTAIKALKRGTVKPSNRIDSPTLRTTVAGLQFSNPLGIAAGFDKNAEVPDALLKRGMGFAEIGTVTPRPQEGNPKPRVFRLPEQKAVINRLGFNNEGFEAAHKRLTARRMKGGIVGVNIGANKDSSDFAEDYIAGINYFADIASYFTVNISSPNTPGLRKLQGVDVLHSLLRGVYDARDEAALKTGYKPPIFVKIAPDLSNSEVESIVGEVLDSGIEGMIVSNTTILRDKIKGHPFELEAGGLSGAPLFNASTLLLARVRRLAGPNLPLIGVGGIVNGATALAKMRAGADLLQVYTGLIYGGFTLIDDIKAVLETAVRKEQVKDVSGLVGLDVDKLLKDG